MTDVTQRIRLITEGVVASYIHDISARTPRAAEADLVQPEAEPGESLVAA
jgi:hypothetical protein